MMNILEMAGKFYYLDGCGFLTDNLFSKSKEDMYRTTINVYYINGNFSCIFEWIKVTCDFRSLDK